MAQSQRPSHKKIAIGAATCIVGAVLALKASGASAPITADIQRMVTLLIVLSSGGWVFYSLLTRPSSPLHALPMKRRRLMLASLAGLYALMITVIASQ
jgi:hypothetical protein